jgi:pantothenate kinase type III
MDILKSFFLFHQVEIEQVEGALLSSVVPSLTKRIQKEIFSLIDIKLLYLTLIIFLGVTLVS